MLSGSSTNAGERRQRARVLILVTALVLFGVAARLFLLQVVQDDQYRKLAETNYLRPEVIPAMRGVIRDRHGVLLASSMPSFTASIDPWHESFRKGPRGAPARARLEDTARGLAAILDLDPAVVLAIVEQQKRASYRPVRIQRNLDIVAITRIAEHRAELPGVSVEMEPLRSYPYGEVGAHLLGYTGEVSDTELEKLRGQGYLPGASIGRAGLERQYETMLKGQDGFRFVEVNALGRRTNQFVSTPPILPRKGRDLVLTIDWRLQEIAEAAFDSAGWSGAPPPPEARGAVVAVDPRNGEVLALVSRPAFNPNDFSTGISHETWAAMNAPGRFPMLNRAVQSRYPPGSTFKPVTLMAGLEAGKVSPSTWLHGCIGGYQFGNRFFRCWNASGHGSTDGLRSLEVSCDVYYYQLGIMLGIDGIAEMSHRMMVADPTGIDLPQERGGLVPDLAWFEKRRGKNIGKGPALNLSIGQGEILMTPVQLASLASSLATGNVPRLHLVKSMSDEPGFEPYVADTTARGRLPVAPATLEYARRGMWRVLYGAEGTGKRAAVDSVVVAGKTGSSQHAGDPTHALFIAFAPYDDPEIAVAVILEERGGGGAFAAPVAQKVLDRYFHPERYLPKPDSLGVDSLGVSVDSLVVAVGTPPALADSLYPEGD
jgi:penicillin-binding protein 2